MIPNSKNSEAPLTLEQCHNWADAIMSVLADSLEEMGNALQCQKKDLLRLQRWNNLVSQNQRIADPVDQKVKELLINKILQTSKNQRHW